MKAAAAARDAVASALARAGVSPNALTIATVPCALAAGWCFFEGATHVSPLDPLAHAGARVTWWPFLGALALTFAAILDVLDGAVARHAGTATPFGGVLDSAVDRIADLAMLLGIAVHCAIAQRPGLVALTVLALAHGFQIAYLRARAEVIVAHPPVGFWQRSERMFAFGIGGAIGHVPAALIVLATLPALTVIRRTRLVHALLEGRAERPTSMRRFTRSYVLAAAGVVSFIACAPWLTELAR